MVAVSSAPLRVPAKFRELLPTFDSLQRHIVSLVERKADNAQSSANLALAQADTATSNVAQMKAGLARANDRLRMVDMTPADDCGTIVRANINAIRKIRFLGDVQ